MTWMGEEGGAVTVAQSERRWTGPAWEDPALIELARRLRDAHGRVALLPGAVRLRLHRNLLAITDLSKRDQALAARRLESFLVDLDAGSDRSASTGETG